MYRLSEINSRRFVVSLALVITCACVGHAQTARDRAGNNSPDSGYSDSDAPRRARTTTTNNTTVIAARNAPDQRPTATDETDPTAILRAARTIYLEPNQHIDADYLEYKLDKLPEFNLWHLAIVKDRGKADLVLTVRRTALNYIFSVTDPASSVVVAKGKVVALNGLVAAEDISHEIIRRMKATRALPTPGS